MQPRNRKQWTHRNLGGMLDLEAVETCSGDSSEEGSDGHVASPGHNAFIEEKIRYGPLGQSTDEDGEGT
jgi:hypothetical protein